MTPNKQSLSERIYGALLRLYPASFRQDFAPDMRDLFRDHLRDARRRAGLAGVALLWLRAIPDLLLTGLHEHEGEMLQAILQDARYAVRMLRRNPVFTLVAMCVVALGTGAVSTIFSVANAIVLRPIPGVAHPSEVVAIERTRRGGGDSRSVSYPYYRYMASASKTMSGIAAVTMVPVTISTGGEGTLAQANLVSGNYFDVLGVTPAMGRFFAPSEDRVPDADAVIVLSHEMWTRRFARDSGIVGKTVLVNGRQFQVIGVAASKFNGLYPVVRTDAWVPMMMQRTVRRGNNLLTSVTSGWLELVGRTAPGVSREAALAELTTLTKQFASGAEVGAGDMSAFTTVRTSPISGLPADVTKPVLAFFVVLIAVSGLVLLIASVNVASMLLARAVSRRREIALRIALGAGRARLIRQLLTESVILFGAGGALGTLLAFYTTRVLGRIQLPIDVPLSVDPTPDARVIAVTLGISLVTGVVFGLAPALQGSRGGIATALRGDTSGAGRTRSRLRTVLVAAQVAASLLLLTTSGLFVRALAEGHQIDPGYDVSNVATAALNVGLSGYDSTRARLFYTTLRDRIRLLAGVQSVGFAGVLPLSMNRSGYDISVPGYVPPAGSSPAQSSNANLVDEGYFEALHLPVMEGRGLSASDNAGTQKVAVVSRRFAERYWPGQSAIGHTFKLDSLDTVTVVGVTRDVHFARLDEQIAPFMYLPISQHFRSDLNLLVRASGDAAALAPAIRSAVHAMDPILPAPVVVTLERAAVASLLPQRFAVIVTASLGVLGLILASIGLYGVVSFSTAQRTREIGVRMALGASPRDVVGLVVREGMKVVGVGVGAGLVLAGVATRALAPFLYGVNPLDLVTYIVMTGILGGTALLACWLPARRAAAGDPMGALREE